MITLSPYLQRYLFSYLVILLVASLLLSISCIFRQYYQLQQQQQTILEQLINQQQNLTVTPPLLTEKKPAVSVTKNTTTPTANPKTAETTNNKIETSPFSAQDKKTYKHLIAVEMDLNQGDIAAAIFKLTKITKQYPNNIAYQFYFGQLLERVGSPQKAIEHYLKITQSNQYQSPYFHKALKRIKQQTLNLPTPTNLLLIKPCHIKKETITKSTYQQEIITVEIPIVKTQPVPLTPHLVAVEINFFEKFENTIRLTKSKVETIWATPPNDWNDAIEKIQASCTFTSKKTLSQQLLDTAKFYGVLIRVFYHGKIQDQRCYPRKLSYQINAMQQVMPNEEMLLPEK